MEGEAEHVWPEMSTTRQVLLVLTMTMCMMLNVRVLRLTNAESAKTHLLLSFRSQIMQVQSVQLALPTLGVDLDIQTTNLQWLISSYSVAFGGLLLLFGRLADIVRLVYRTPLSPLHAAVDG